MKKPIHIIVAMQESDQGIGFEGKLLYNLPEDLKRFKTLTTGNAVIMGRKTWESIPEKFRPLPNRTNIVVTKNREFKIEQNGVEIAYSLDEAIKKAKEAPGENIFIIGGSSLYNETLCMADIIDLTLIHDENNAAWWPKPADTFFDGYNAADWWTVEQTDMVDPANGLKYSFITQKRA